MSHHIVDFIDLDYIYPDGNHALRDINIRIQHGESVAVVGANGAGKSTMLMLLVGIHLPSKGEIRLGDTPVTAKTLPLIRQRVGYTFQDADDQLFTTSVYEDVAFGPRNYGLDEKEVEKRVDKALRTVGIEHLRERAPYKLSGGEKRAAAIATVLSMEPDVLALDEPTAALDPKARRRLIELLQSFKHTKIIATHDLDMVIEVCQRTVVLKAGKVVWDGPTKELLQQEDLLKENGLELPLAMQGCPICGQKRS